MYNCWCKKIRERKLFHRKNSYNNNVVLIYLKRHEHKINLCTCSLHSFPLKSVFKMYHQSVSKFVQNILQKEINFMAAQK